MEQIHLIIAPLIFVQILLTVIALIDLINRERTNGPKWLWLIIILLIATLGPIIYFIFGRKDYS